MAGSAHAPAATVNDNRAVSNGLFGSIFPSLFRCFFTVLAQDSLNFLRLPRDKCKLPGQKDAATARYTHSRAKGPGASPAQEVSSDRDCRRATNYAASNTMSPAT